MSKNPQLNILRYWRNTLADAARIMIEVDKTLNQRNAKIDIAKGAVHPAQTLTLFDAF